jgi:hypothetical protein
MPHGDDYQALVAQKRFLVDVERGIQLANREIIHQRISEVTSQSFLAMAVMVGRFRATYLEAAQTLATEAKAVPSPQAISDLRAKREAYEEAAAAFEALRRAIEQGYVDVQLDSSGAGAG